jgi:hypothetical protein
MTHFNSISRYFAAFLVTVCLGTSAVHAQSFTYSPDTLTFTPTSQDSVIGYVRIAYHGDTTGPGTNIHAWISEGSSYFGCPTDTVFTKSYFYLRVAYKPQTSNVHGTLSISDDTVTKTVLLIGNAYVAEDAELSGVGPYFPTNQPEGKDTCTTMRLVNSGTDLDTIVSAGWTHNPEGIFSWDTVSLPKTLGSHDTTYWTFCFNAPDNTTLYIDTFVIQYRDSASQTRSISRIVEGQAVVPTDGELSSYGPYFPTYVPEGVDTCTTMRLINTGSDVDTIESMAWSHDPNGIFTWDSVSLPRTLGPNDTTFWSYCFHAPDDTSIYYDSIIISYHDAYSHTRSIVRIVGAKASAPSDGELQCVGPYFPSTVLEGHDTCTTMRLVNSGTDIDTVESMTWSHDPNGIFTWDSVSLPFTVGSQDTTFWTYCFHAPDNADTYTDTLTIHYHDAASQSRYDTRIVSGKAYVPEDGALNLYDGPYFPDVVDEGHDTCATMRVINSGADLDTIVSVAWSHDPNGIFTWDSVSLPATIGSNDTDIWTFCFHAPDDTNLYIDTFTVYYRDAYGHQRYSTRIVEGKATDPNITTCYTLYAATFATTNIGDTSEVTMYIRNDLKHTSSLTSIHISGTDDGTFRVDSSNFPLSIDSGAYGEVLLKFIPNRHDGSDEYNATLTASFSTDDTTHCREASVALLGYMPQACSDTATVDIDTTGVHDVDITGDSATYYAHRIDIVNNTNNTIIVTQISFIDSTSHFYIYQTIPGTPDTLAPGKGMAVIIHFYGDTGQIYYDTLAVTIQNGITIYGGKATPLSGPSTLLIGLKGEQLAAPASVTNNTPSGPSLALYPNPSSGLVTMQIDGATNATFQIMDILGNMVASHVGSGTWQWDATAAGLTNGTYFVRATSGTSVTTKRLVLQR